MEFKGTQGEWKANENTTRIECGNEIITLGGFLRFYDDTRLENESWLGMRKRTEIDRITIQKEREANAKLIAAAPDLLKALDDLLEVDSSNADAVFTAERNGLNAIHKALN